MSMLIIDAYPRLAKVDKSREIGIEIEIEGNNLFGHGAIATVDKWWTTHQDGSLRGNAIEYVLHTPVSRKHVAPALSALKTAFRANETVINDSDRVGVHVHINCQSLTIDQVINFLLVYYIFEDALVRYCGEEREGNLFCLRAQDAEGLLSALRTAKRTGSFSNFREEHYRYASVNIPALMKFGTLEFRSLKTPQDMDEINPWVEMLLDIKDESLSFKDGKQIIETFSENGEHAYLKKVFGKRAKQLSFDDLSVMLRNGVRRIQDVAYATPAPKVAATKKKYNLNQYIIDTGGRGDAAMWAEQERRRISGLNTRYIQNDPSGTPKPQRGPEMPPNHDYMWDRFNERFTVVDYEHWNVRPFPGVEQPAENPEEAPIQADPQGDWEERDRQRLDDLNDRYWSVREAVEAEMAPEEPDEEDYIIPNDSALMWDSYNNRWDVVNQGEFRTRPYQPPARPVEAAQPAAPNGPQRMRWGRDDAFRNWGNLYAADPVEEAQPPARPANPVPRQRARGPDQVRGLGDIIFADEPVQGQDRQEAARQLEALLDRDNERDEW